MELHIYGRNLEIDDTVREHVESKLNLIDRHLPGITNVTVELAFEATRSHNDRIVAQVTLHVGRTLLRAQQRAATTKSAVSSVAKTLDRQIERFKSHAYRSERSRLAGRGGVGDEALEEIANNGATGSTEVFAGGQVVRLKEFDMDERRAGGGPDAVSGPRFLHVLGFRIGQAQRHISPRGRELWTDSAEIAP